MISCISERALENKSCVNGTCSVVTRRYHLRRPEGGGSISIQSLFITDSARSRFLRVFSLPLGKLSRATLRAWRVQEMVEARFAREGSSSVERLPGSLTPHLCGSEGFVYTSRVDLIILVESF